MKVSFVKARQIILVLGDLLVLYGSLALTLLVRYGTITRDDWTDHFFPFTIVYLVWIIVFYINDLYNYNLTRLEFIQRGVIAMLINAGLTATFFYLFHAGIAPRINFLLNLLLAGILLAAWRFIDGKLISKKKARRVLFIGEAPEEQEVYEYLKKRDHWKYTPVATIPTAELDLFAEKLENFITKHSIDTIVVCVNLTAYPRIAGKLYALLGRDIHITHAINFYEEVFSRIPLSVLDAVWFLENIHEEDKEWYEFIKRGFDILMGVLGGICLIILLPFIALAIKLDHDGPIIYAQKRLGKNRKEFTLYKFRTMREGAEPNGPQFASADDPRITRIGRILRKTRLDELPQILNVLRGDMSVIGPRPERAEFVKELENKFPFYTVRNLIKPGLTGWAQIYYNYAASLEENLRKLQYDFFYIKNRSVLLDLMIALKTLNILVRLRGR